MKTDDTQVNQAEQGNQPLEPHHDQSAHDHERGAHHHGHGSHHDEPMTAEEAMRSLLLLGEVAMNAQDYESAFEAYASALKLGQNEVAAYNLGSLYARGLAVKRNYLEAARLFRQAELLGNERAGKLCAKCMLDFLCEGIDDKEPVELYAAMAVFVMRVYPEAADQKAEVGRGLHAVANTLLHLGQAERAEKVLRAAQEYGED